MSERFHGAWRVREYVFDPAGHPIGTVAQRRRLEPTTSGVVRVIQDCDPDPSLADHPMAAFRGHHEFSLVIDGARRQYRGPAVIGSGVAYGAGAMLGRGVWPRFGYNFRSWSVATPGHRQLTGGVFSRAGVPMAVIVGVAHPEGDGAEDPTLGEPLEPSAVSRAWTGSLQQFAADGGGGELCDLERVYTGSGFRELGTAPWSIQTDGRCAVTGGADGETVAGFARRWGWGTSYELTCADGRHVDGFEVVDPAGGQMVGFRRHRDGEQITRVEVLRLHETEVFDDEE